MNSGIYLSADVLPQLSAEAMAEILACLGRTSDPHAPFAPIAPLPRGGSGLELALVQAQRVIENPLSDQTRAVLRAIADIGPAFTLFQIARHVGKEWEELGGVWAGITRRVRSVVGDRSVELIQWSFKPEGEDQKGRVSAKTHAALKEAFSLAG